MQYFYFDSKKRERACKQVGLEIAKSMFWLLVANSQNLIFYDVLYVLEARRNLLSASKLAQDRFQVVLPANNSKFGPGIYNSIKNKS